MLEPTRVEVTSGWRNDKHGGEKKFTYLISPWSRVLFEKLRQETLKYFPWVNFW